MKKYIFIIATIIILLASFPLSSCGGGAAVTPAPPTGTTEKAAEATPTKPVAALPPATATPTESATPKPSVTPSATMTTTPAMTTPTAPPNLPDLKPYLVDGKTAVTVDTSNPDYKKFLIKAGVANAGQVTANNVTVELYNGSSKIYTWNIGQLKNGENKVLEATVVDILKQSQIFSGQYSLNINCALAGGGREIDGNNNKSDTYKAILAPPPVPGRESQSATEKTIQDAIKNSTWFTNSNRDQLMSIVKDVLKDAFISWSTISVDLVPFDKFNDSYANSFGTTDADKQQIKQTLANNKLPGMSYLWGTTQYPQVCIREGTLMQVLPILMFQLGVISYGQGNFGGYSIGNKVNATKLAGSLMEAYGIRIMREKYGLSGLINMSAYLNTIQYPNLKASTLPSANMRRMWAIAANEGYPNGDIPSDKLIKLFLSLTTKADPTSYVSDLDNKADLMDKAAIENIIRWRLVNKEPTLLPAATAQKIDPSASNLSLDMVISYQEFVAFP